MSAVIANTSMSLDGFIDDSEGGDGDRVTRYAGGSHVTRMPGDEREF